MGNRTDVSPIHKIGDIGEVERAAPLNPEELSQNENCYNSSRLGENHEGRYDRPGQTLQDVKRERSPNALEQLRPKESKNSSRMDPEVARYASNVKVQISKEENRRLRKLIDIRILVVMVFVS
jgi:hypothetical protein